MRKIIFLLVLTCALYLPTTASAKTTKFLGDQFAFDMLDVQNFNVIAAISSTNPQGFRFFNENITGTIVVTESPTNSFPHFITEENWAAASFNEDSWKNNIQTQMSNDATYELVAIEKMAGINSFMYVVKKELGRDKYYNVIAQKIIDGKLYVVTFSTTERFINPSKDTARTIINSIQPRKNQPR